MKPFVERLRELREGATPGPWMATLMQKKWMIHSEGRLGGHGTISKMKVKWHVAFAGGAPGNGPTAIEANAKLIELLANHAAAIEQVVRACEPFTKSADICAHSGPANDYDSLCQALSHLNEDVT